MNKDMFKLGQRDVIKAIVVTVLVALLGALQNALTTNGLDVMSYDWMAILDVAWKAGVAYLAKNFLSDRKDMVLGKI